MGRALKVLGLAVVMLATTMPQAGAVREVETKWTIYEENSFTTREIFEVYGFLSSKKDECVVDRTVIVTYAPKRRDAHEEYGRDEATDPLDGEWTTTRTVPDTTHFVITLKKKKVGNLLCLGNKTTRVFYKDSDF